MTLTIKMNRLMGSSYTLGAGVNLEEASVGEANEGLGRRGLSLVAFWQHGLQSHALRVKLVDNNL